VRFRYPPQSLGQEKTTRSLYAVTVPAATNTQGTSASPQHIRRSDDPNTPNVTTYPLTGLVLEGRDVREQIERLTNWATRPQVPTDRTEPATSKLPDLVMTWGQGFVDVPVCLAKLQATYVRFEPDGTPTRAKVSVTLEQREVKQGATVRAGQPAPSGGRARSTANTANPPRPNAAPSRRQRRGARNPTSGGVPGRAVHLLAPGQTLPGLARDAYDEPGAWRALAAANDIDDPLRVRPGATLYLPARSELTR
jgi:nucleoid-associated protein YgaU